MRESLQFFVFTDIFKLVHYALYSFVLDLISCLGQLIWKGMLRISENERPWTGNLYNVCSCPGQFWWHTLQPHPLSLSISLYLSLSLYLCVWDHIIIISFHSYCCTSVYLSGIHSLSLSLSFSLCLLSVDYPLFPSSRFLVNYENHSLSSSLSLPPSLTLSLTLSLSLCISICRSLSLSFSR